MVANDMRGLAQQNVTISHYCTMLAKGIDERDRIAFQERTAERAGHEAQSRSYLQQLNKANDTIDRLNDTVERLGGGQDSNQAHTKTDKARKVDLERKTERLNEKIHNQKRRINEQQSQIEVWTWSQKLNIVWFHLTDLYTQTLKRKISEGSKLSKLSKEGKANKANKVPEIQDVESSPEIPLPHSATTREDARPESPIQQPPLPSNITLRDEEYLLKRLMNKTNSAQTNPAPSRNGRIFSARATRMDQPKYGQLPPPQQFGQFSHQVPQMPTMGPGGPINGPINGPVNGPVNGPMNGPMINGPMAPYGHYHPGGPHGGPGLNFRNPGMEPNDRAHVGYPGYAPTGPQTVPFNRSRPSHSAHSSQAGHAGALVLRPRDDNSEIDPETKIWKDLFMRLFKTVGGWSETHCRQVIPGAAEAATRGNPKLWEYMLKIAACHKDPQAAPKHALHMLNSLEHRTHFITRLLLQYIEQEMLQFKVWLGWDENADRNLQHFGPMVGYQNYPFDMRRHARQQTRDIVESIINDGDYARFRRHKTTEHAQRLKEIAGAFLSTNADAREANVGLHSIANLAMEISGKMLTSRLTFAFTWNECAVKFSNESHIAINSNFHGVSLQISQHRVMLVVTPAISYREHSGYAILPRSVTKAQVLIMK